VLIGPTGDEVDGVAGADEGTPRQFTHSGTRHAIDIQNIAELTH
jgi:hypothetical protein